MTTHKMRVDICKVYIYKGVRSRTYKELLELNDNIKGKQPMKKCSKELNRHFSKEDMQIADKHMNKKIKVTMRHNFIPTRMAVIFKMAANRCWQGDGHFGMFIHC
jgi:hypothetical protein